jgi:hypothetical protein
MSNVTDELQLYETSQSAKFRHMDKLADDVWIQKTAI